MSLEDSQADLEKLEAAIARGTLTVEYPSGRRHTYQSATAMHKIADQLRRDIQAKQGRPSIRIATWTGTK